MHMTYEGVYEKFPRSIPAGAGEPGAANNPGASVNGLIPAGAGEPITGGNLTLIDEVYPRGCGGTAGPPAEEHIDQGLSPRVRGNRRNPQNFYTPDGSIPAGAGEPKPLKLPVSYRKVYPRGCGGTGYPGIPLVHWPGLSPRVRGNRWFPTYRRCRLGSIPAGAGEPTRYPKSRAGAEVYPRGCGGTATSPAAMFGMRGLSPRVRGNQSQSQLRASQ